MQIKTPKKQLEYLKQYRFKNRKKIKALQKRWRVANKIKIIKDNQAWDKKNPKRRKEIQRRASLKYCNAHKEEKKIMKLKRMLKDPIKFKELHAHSARKNSYGLTKEAYELMRKEQKNRCKICNTKFFKTPHVDHCHKSGKIRGLLCFYCNNGLGIFKDNPMFLLEAARYLIKSRSPRRGK